MLSYDEIKQSHLEIYLTDALPVHTVILKTKILKKSAVEKTGVT